MRGAVLFVSLLATAAAEAPAAHTNYLLARKHLIGDECEAAAGGALRLSARETEADAVLRCAVDACHS